MNKNNLNRILQAGDVIPDIQICPFGEIPATSVGGVSIMQVFDEEGLTDVTLKSKLPVRCDIDHKSELTNDTEAAGWIETLHIDPERGLTGDIKLTQLGADVLNDESYKFGSPAFDVDPNTGKPVRMTSFAFTNRPRIRAIEKIWNMEPTLVNNTKGLNMEDDKDKELDKKAEELDEKTEELDEKTEETAEESPEEKIEDTPEDAAEESPEEKKEDEDEEEKVENEGPAFIDAVKEAIGLPPEATEDDVIATIEEWKKLIEGQKAEVIAEEAEEIVNSLNIDGANKDVILNFYKKDPDTAKTVLNVFKGLPTKSLYNEATKPVLNTDEALREEYAKIPGGQKRVDFLLKHNGRFI